MRYLILVLILVVLAVTGAALGGFGFLPGVFAAEKAWLEIISPAILEIDESGAVIRELRSGDEISSGSRLRGEAGSFANIHFPDGSAARIDGETTIILRDSEFDAKTGKLIVRFELVAGRIWCKIFSLATDDSAWEVITPTAVAVVRGTAFGVEYLNNKTSVVGAENMVEVIPVDSETKELIKAASAKVLADDVLEITEDLAREAKRDVKILARRVEKLGETAAGIAAAAPGVVVRDIREKDWVKRAKVIDEKFDENVRELKKEAKENLQEVRRAARIPSGPIKLSRQK